MTGEQLMKQISHLAAAVICTTLAQVPLATAQTAPPIPPSNTTADKVETSLGTLDTRTVRRAKSHSDKVYDNLDLMHGVEAFATPIKAPRWRHPQGAARPASRTTQLVMFSDLMDAKSLFLTANADTPISLSSRPHQGADGVRGAA